MEIQEIRAFVLLAEYLHYGRTAKLLNLTQPALTKKILRLEAFFGSPLFDRDRQGTRLTTFGAQILQESKAFIAQYEQLCLLGQKISQGEKGLLRIGFGLYAFEMVPRLIVQLRQSHPGIELILKDLSTYEQLEALRSQQLDIGFVRLSSASSEFDILPVAQEQLSLITPSHATFSRVTHLSQCQDTPFVIISKDHSPVLHNQILQLCTDYGFHPRIVQEVADVTSLLALVKAGLGVTMLPPSFCSPNFSGLNYFSQKESEASWSIYTAWRKEDSNPALAIFLRFLKAEVGG